MSGAGQMLEEMTGRLFREHCTQDLRSRAESGEWPADLWRQAEAAGLSKALVPEALGGAGATLGEAAAIMRAVGAHAVPLPLVESVLGNWLLARAGAPAAAGPLTVAPVTAGACFELSRGNSGWVLRGIAPHVPWARAGGHIVVVADSGGGRQAVVLVAAEQCRIRGAVNVAAEPRDEVVIDSAIDARQVFELPAGRDHNAALFQAGALARCQQMAGAMGWILDRCCAYAGERVQFGKPIGNFQAVQQMIAAMAGQAAAASMATDSATIEWEKGEGGHAAGYAKARVGEAAGEVAELAHQVHGAMGYGFEYPLHFRTRRIWAWRDEFGSERFWQVSAGRRLASRGGAVLWHDLAL